MIFISKMKKHRFISIRKIIRTSIIILALLVFSGYIFSKLSSSVTQNADDYKYALPYKPGTSHKVVQGYGGLFSHKNLAALDFSMPEGTAIYAAREGVVYAYKDDSDEGGPFTSYKAKANYIILRHSDGSFGCYWHLQKNGVVIKKGKIEKGQMIGYSGATGLVLRPHLHFSVKRKLNYDKNSFLQTKFATSTGLQFLENAEAYENPVN
jgi:murein DD-endopeptidase MepM/ murein hydrolase activator NlpD